jgi:hypothetical protein
MSNFTSPSQRAYRFIDNDDRLRSLNTHVSEIMRWQKIWRSIAPSGLAEVSRIGQIQTDSINIYCDNGAAAAKLRQLTSTLSTAFAKYGFGQAQVLIKVRTNALPSPTEKPQKSDIGSTALSELNKLHADLETGELKDALAKLLHRHQPAL